MKVHETNGGSKRKHDEMEEQDETLTKYLIEKTNEYERKTSSAGSATLGDTS